MNKFFQVLFAGLIEVSLIFFIMAYSNTYHPNIVGLIVLTVLAVINTLWLFVLGVDFENDTGRESHKQVQHSGSKEIEPVQYITNNIIVTDENTGKGLLKALENRGL